MLNIKSFIFISTILINFSVLSSNYERNLKEAVKSNRTFTVQSIFEALYKTKAHVNLNSQDKDGDTLLHFAVGWSNKGIVNLLLQNGADPNVCNKLGETAFYNENDPEMVSVFVKYGAKGDIANKKGINALQRAVTLGLVDIARIFLRAGSNVNVIDANGDTLLMKAAIAGNNELVQLLLDFDANAFIKNKNGEFILEVISSYFTRTILIGDPKFYRDMEANLSSRYSRPFMVDVEYWKKHSKIKMENDRSWLEQNLYDYFLVNETINKIDYPNLKPRKFCHLDRRELLNLRNDLLKSIEKMKSKANKFSYEASFNKALKDVCTSLEIGAGSLGVDIT